MGKARGQRKGKTGGQRKQRKVVLRLHVPSQATACFTSIAVYAVSHASFKKTSYLGGLGNPLLFWCPSYLSGHSFSTSSVGFASPSSLRFMPGLFPLSFLQGTFTYLAAWWASPLGCHTGILTSPCLAVNQPKTQSRPFFSVSQLPSPVTSTSEISVSLTDHLFSSCC